MNNEVKHEFTGTPGPWYAIQYACYWEVCAEPFYGEPDLLNEDHCIHASRNAHLAASAPFLLSALINILDFPQEDLQSWRSGNSPVPITITPSQLDSALSAIESALNLKTVQK